MSCPTPPGLSFELAMNSENFRSPVSPWGCLDDIPQTLNECMVYLPTWKTIEILTIHVNVGKYTSSIEYLGTRSPFFARWCFERFYIFIPNWGNDPMGQIFFRWVETTN